MDMLTPIFLVGLGFVPSLFWLRFYLKRDVHPEPRHLIAKTVAVGFLLAPLAAVAQWLFGYIATRFIPGFDISQSMTFFLWAALAEEYVKYLAVKFVIVHNPEFDEPTDAMIYMIAAALGFAAIENILFLLGTNGQGVRMALALVSMRFIGATLLHAVSSAALGYLLALSWFYHRHSRAFIFLGILIATAFHFVFNLLLMNASSQAGAILQSSGILVIFAVLIGFLFRKLKARMTAE